MVPAPVCIKAAPDGDGVCRGADWQGNVHAADLPGTQQHTGGNEATEASFVRIHAAGSGLQIGNLVVAVATADDFPAYIIGNIRDRDDRIGDNSAG